MPDMRVLNPDALHDIACAATRLAGAVLCESLIDNTEGKLADTVFVDERVIVEVKSLLSDRLETDSVKRKAGDIVSSAADEGRIERLERPWKRKLGDFPEDVREELIDNAGKRIIRELANANRQIRETITALQMEGAAGLAIFVVPMHFRLHIELVAHIAIKELTRNSLRSLNGALILEAPSFGKGPQDNILRAQPVSSVGRDRPADEIVERISVAWYHAIKVLLETDMIVSLPPHR